MFQELKFQLSTAILTILTLAARVGALLNFQQQQRFHLTEDGVIWIYRNGGVEALSAPAASEGYKAGLRTGDRLKMINGLPIQRALEVPQVLASVGSWKKSKYYVSRNG